MPYCDVAEMLNPSIVIQFLPATSNPRSWPVTMTVASGAALKTIGAAALPDARILTYSGYVPDPTTTVPPATILAAAPLIVQNGEAAVP